MASWHLAELQHFSPITKHSFSDCWTFFSAWRTFFGCVWCHLNCAGQSTTQWLRWWWGPFLVGWSIFKYFLKVFLSIFGCVWYFISTVAVNPQLNDFSSGEALFWSCEVFLQIPEKQHFATWPFYVVTVVFSCQWKYVYFIIQNWSRNISQKHNHHHIQSLQNKICKTLCKFNWKGFRINLQITHVKGCLQLKRLAKFSGFRIKPPISGNLCQRRSGGARVVPKGGN